MLHGLRDLWDDQDGETAIEYALLLSTVSLAAIGAWERLGETVSQIVTNCAEQLEQAQ